MTVLGPAPPVSVVVNTLDRADALESLLGSLRHLTYPHFEVVVVAGPCRDDTVDVLARWSDDLVVRWCPEANLAMSRNIGLAAAAGEIVAFIDDDAIPECGWLDELVAGYDDDEVAAVGGFVHDHTGHGYQSRFIFSDRIGRSRLVDEAGVDAFCFPGSFEFPSLLGCNSSFRRDRLVEVGGFDEQYDYFLDETDVCVRLVDAGYVIRQLDGAPVHHKYLPSSVRSHERVVRDYLPVVRNGIYFGLQHAVEHLSVGGVLEANAAWVRRRHAELDDHHERGLLDDEALVAARASIEAAWQPGLEAGFRGRVRAYVADRDERRGLPLRQFPTVRPAGRRLRVALVTQTLPPSSPGGIGRYSRDLAAGLTARGHEVRLLTSGDDDLPTVDLEEPGWVHRIPKVLPDGERWYPEAPERIEANARAVADELARLQRELGPLDVVCAPIWDVEGLATQRACSAPLVTSLHTTMALALTSQDGWRSDERFMATVGGPLVALEQRMLESSEGVLANSEAVSGAIEATSGVTLDRSGLLVAPHGVADAGPVATPPSSGCTFLFAGRLERRKGIDLVLAAVPEVLAALPDARFVLVGRDDLPDGDGATPRQAFESRHAGAPWWDRVEFRGEIDDDALLAAFGDCDVLVAPSRFESFGLVFVEAMRAGRPVVAVRAGAAPEVVEDGETGVLVEPGDPEALVRVLVRLGADGAERARLGEAGRRRFEARYTLDAMVDAVEAALGSVRSWRPGDEGVTWPAGRRPVPLPDGAPGISARGAGVRVSGMGPGRTTVVVHPGDEGGGLVTVWAGERRHEVVVDGGPGFRHVALPFDPGGALVVCGPVTFAAVHVVSGAGAAP